MERNEEGPLYVFGSVSGKEGVTFFRSFEKGGRSHWGGGGGWQLQFYLEMRI